MRRSFHIAAALLAACTSSGVLAPAPGRFCREDAPNACWDIDLTAKTATIVLPNGERGFKNLPLGPGVNDADYSTDAGANNKVLFKVMDRNTIGVRNGGSPKWERFLRR